MGVQPLDVNLLSGASTNKRYFLLIASVSRLSEYPATKALRLCAFFFPPIFYSSR